MKNGHNNTGKYIHVHILTQNSHSSSGVVTPGRVVRKALIETLIAFVSSIKVQCVSRGEGEGHAVVVPSPLSHVCVGDRAGEGERVTERGGLICQRGGKIRCHWGGWGNRCSHLSAVIAI